MSELIYNKDLHYCKLCDTTFRINISKMYTGDAIIICPVCSKQHSRQFEIGIAVSCDTPTTKPLYIKGVL